MASKQIEEGLNTWGKGNLTIKEIDHYSGLGLKKADLREKLINGDVPPFDEKDKITKEDIYKAGAMNACPATEELEKEMGTENVMNSYVVSNKAFRMIKRLLRTTHNETVSKLWEGNADRTEEEVRISQYQENTPTKINELNQHVGIGKYESFALCSFLQALVDKGTKNGKLYLPMDEYTDCAAEATDLNDLNARVIEKTLPNMLEKGVEKEETVKILLDCYLPEAILIEDNTWTRSETTAKYIGDKLAENKDENLKTVGQMFLEKIPGEIQRIREKVI